MGVAESVWGFGGFHAPVDTGAGEAAAMTDARLDAAEILEEIVIGNEGAGTGVGGGTDAVGKDGPLVGAPFALKILIIRFCNSACLSAVGDSREATGRVEFTSLSPSSMRT